jgi:hypothetical protein
LWSHGADNQNFTQPPRQKHDQHCILNYNIINRFTIAKKSREKKNPIALNYYCQEMRCWSNQHLWFSKNCWCVSCKCFLSKWLTLVFPLDKYSCNAAALVTTEVMLCSRQQNWSKWHLQNEILLLHLTINHSIICIRQRLTQREDLWELSVLSYRKQVLASLPHETSNWSLFVALKAGSFLLTIVLQKGNSNYFYYCGCCFYNLTSHNQMLGQSKCSVAFLIHFSTKEELHSILTRFWLLYFITRSEEKKRREESRSSLKRMEWLY